MPTYVYKFVDTGETIEVQQAFSDNALTEAEHPTTGEVRPVKKVFTPVGVSFKGGGFYKTDSRGGAGAKAAKGSGDGASSEASSSTTTSDTSTKSTGDSKTTSSETSKASDTSKAASSSSSTATSGD